MLLIASDTDSFGNAVFMRFLNADIKEIHIFSRDKKRQGNMLYRIQNYKDKLYM